MRPSSPENTLSPGGEVSTRSEPGVNRGWVGGRGRGPYKPSVCKKPKASGQSTGLPGRGSIARLNFTALARTAKQAAQQH